MNFSVAAQIDTSVLPQKTTSERVACHPIYALCEVAERMPGTSWLVQWWDQDALNKPEE